MYFENQYFEAEVRDGFYVPGEIKRAWAAELEVLSEVDKICKKHNIQYFADWGTLLATVRHEGFIPWDDDLDIVMKRADYKRFMEVANEELPEGFRAYNYKNHDDFWLFLARVVGKPRICFEEEHLERFHQFPYIAGLDIFVLDYVSRDEEEEKKRNELAMYVIATADGIANGQINETGKEVALERIQKEVPVSILENLQGDDLRRFLYGVAEDLFAKFDEDESDMLTQLYPFGMIHEKFRFPKEYYAKSVRLPYEVTTIPAPIRYIETLRRRYGEFMKLVKDAGGHNYPFFKTQHEQLLRVLDFELPTYEFSENQLRANIVMDKSASFKELVDECSKAIVKQISVGNLQEAQQLSIEMGILIESIKGEKTRTVHKLEELCDDIYVLAECLYNDTKMQGEIDEMFEAVKEQTEIMRRILHEELLKRDTVAFVVNKVSQCDYIKNFVLDECENTENEVVVVITPYFYKKYDGSLFGEVFQFDEISQVIDGWNANVIIEDGKNYDIAFAFPKRIYIQNPFDEWNKVVSLNEKYFAKNLQRCTDELIYVQSFELADFGQRNEREFANMDYYVTVPGVVRADLVYTQSEALKETYIDKLTQWAGEESRSIWEEKIKVMAEKTEGKVDLVQKSVKDRKRLAYFVQMASLLEYGQGMIDKINRVLKVFGKEADKLEVIWLFENTQETELRKYDSEIADKYVEMRKTFVREGYGKELEIHTLPLSQLVDTCDAYYGDESRVGLEFNLAGKPVLIQDAVIA